MPDSLPIVQKDFSSIDDFDESDDISSHFSPDSCSVLVPSHMHGFRIDKAASLLFPDFSRNQVQALLEEGALLYNGVVVKKRLSVHETDVLSLSEEFGLKKYRQLSEDLSPQEMNFVVLYEDEDLFVIDKPKGLVVHPGAGNRDNTFVNGFLYRFPEIMAEGFDPKRPGLVHRLDKDTTGVLIAAKNKKALWRLSQQFQDRTVYKEYIALVWGRAQFTERAVQNRIGRSERDRKRMTVVQEGGKEAISYISSQKTYQEASRVKIELKTGRTHQIRVHLQHVGLPIIGDEVYSSPELKLKSRRYAARPMLHCHKMVIQHPTTGNTCTFVANLPPDMVECESQCAHIF